MTDTEDLKALGSNTTNYNYDEPSIDILEKFESPSWEEGQNPGTAQQISIKNPEFTSLCPKTGQPDFATLIVEYSPRKWCVESKSFKLYCMAFRQHGDFHEACVHRIITDLTTLLDPWWMTVQGQFTPRGGIPFWPTSRWEHPTLRQPQGAGLMVPPGARRQ